VIWKLSLNSKCKLGSNNLLFDLFFKFSGLSSINWTKFIHLFFIHLIYKIRFKEWLYKWSNIFHLASGLGDSKWKHLVSSTMLNKTQVDPLDLGFSLYFSKKKFGIFLIHHFFKIKISIFCKYYYVNFFIKICQKHAI